TTLNLKWEGAAAGKDPLEIAQQVLGGQWESPDSVTLKNKVQEHDFFEQGGAKVTFDGTHAPYTETTTQVTFDTRDAERHELAALFKGDKAQAKKFNPEASQTVERFSFEGPDFDIKPEIKIPKVAKGMDLSIGVELESGIQRRDALIEKTLDPGEAVDQIRSNIAEPLLSPLPVTLGGPNSTPELAEVASTKPLLGPGSSGADVAEAQEFLKDQGYGLGEADGIYGPATSAAVERFQSDHGLASDGVLGKETWTKLLQGAHGGSPSAGAPERGLPAPVVGSEDGARLGVPDLPGPDGLQEAAETVAKVVVGAPLLAGQKLSEGVSSEWNKLSDAEKAYVQENPRLAGAFKWAKESTDRVSVEMGFEKNNSDKGIYGDQGGNAYRHALWNALMVKNAFNQDFRPLTSRQDKLADAAHEAKAMADAHEDNPKNTDVLNMEMDFHN
ncbi:MAG: peptidoglycan-binding domain-containing protein, partial [Myxococcota bacterium]